MHVLDRADNVTVSFTDGLDVGLPAMPFEILTNYGFAADADNKATLTDTQERECQGHVQPPKQALPDSRKLE